MQLGSSVELRANGPSFEFRGIRYIHPSGAGRTRLLQNPQLHLVLHEVGHVHARYRTWAWLKGEGAASYALDQPLRRVGTHYTISGPLSFIPIPPHSNGRAPAPLPRLPPQRCEASWAPPPAAEVDRVPVRDRDLGVVDVVER
jgi:hypothetical protein